MTFFVGRPVISTEKRGLGALPRGQTLDKFFDKGGYPNPWLSSEVKPLELTRGADYSTGLRAYSVRRCTVSILVP